MIFTMVDEETEETDVDMRKKYVDASSKKSEYEQIKAGLEKEIQMTEKESYDIHMYIKETFIYLDKIALVANVYDSENYFDQLI